MNNISLTASETNGVFSRINERLNRPGFSTKEQAFFIKRLAFLIKAGVPILECLHILKEQAGKKNYAKILEKIIDDIANGKPLSKSFAKFPRLFNNFAVSIIKVGESTGMLNETLSYLADELKKKQMLKKKVVGAFMYPAIISVATIGITVFLMVYLFPKIMPVFVSMKVDLPMSTRMVIAMSAFFQVWWFLCVAVVFLFVFVFTVSLKKFPKFHLKFDKACLKIPVVGPIIGYYNVSNGSRTLGLLLRAGISLSEALPITADTTANTVYQKEWNDLVAVVSRGEKISTQLLKRQKYFPDIFSHMIAVGEKSGSLAETFVYLSDLYESEVEDFTKNISTAVEPVLMVIMGIIVGFIAISIISPIYSITQNLHA